MTRLARHLPLSVPVYQILLTLSDRALHGYAIIRDIRERTYRIAADGRELLRLEALRLERSAQMARDKRVIPALADARPGAKRS